MGTKLEPGAFDCYANAKPDEPMFILLARDPVAPWLVQLWAAVKYGDDAAFDDAIENGLMELKPKPLNAAKRDEALDCAVAMKSWRIDNPDV